jgi:hypothetical protein
MRKFQEAEVKKILLIAAALILAGCSSSSNNGNSLASNLLSKAASEITPSDPWVMFAAMAKAQSSATSYREKMVADNSGREMEMESELSCPGRSHSRMLQGGRVMTETYFIDGNMYLTYGGRNMKMPAHSQYAPGCPGASQERGSSGVPSLGGGGMNFKDAMQGLKQMEQAKDRTKITKGGTSLVEGSPCQVWDIDYTDEQNQTSHVEYCIGIADNLPRHMAVNSAQGKMDVTYWDWNKPVAINAPSM